MLLDIIYADHMDHSTICLTYHRSVPFVDLYDVCLHVT